MEKNYFEKKAIDVGEEEPVKYVFMGVTCMQGANEKAHLMTNGLGPCVGVAITITDKRGQNYRLLSHVDMGLETKFGNMFESLKSQILQLKDSVEGEIDNIDVMFASSESYRNPRNWSNEEWELASIVMELLNISLKDIKHSYDSQIQISPDGKIRTFNDKEINEHNRKLMTDNLRKVGGFIDLDLNVYVVPQFGAYMCDSSLYIEGASNKQINEEILSMIEKYIKYGIYNICLGPSFCNPELYAVYVRNYKDIAKENYGSVPGCISAKLRDFENYR